MTSRLVWAYFFHNPTVGVKFAKKKSQGLSVINIVIPKPYFV